MNPEIVQDLKKVIFLLNTRSSLYKEFKDKDSSFKPLCIEFNDLITDALFEFSEKYQDTVFGVRNAISPRTGDNVISFYI